ncbi:large conductance mechanosensitive channel [Nannocystis exedens]|uniref:Large-conductance mechanosensitive channel n=1 Tax=Nannocystis exedens TaxID=54 RepID=A0A1I1Y0P1_9BACT|nr:large-conductance mechanosensitive channel protein MscL [Nannocystis exedens]PCC71742.1 large conductance mechanosensitive channel protein MscL [Nannocystis exedens]SFE13114.1 large conductance mechanosensitive channel [Nannocystis exedens]
MLSGFKKFAMRGSLIDMASGIILGAAFGAIVKSLVDDVIMPPIGLLLGGVDFSNLFVVLKQGAPAGPYDTLAAATSAGAVTIRYGVFLNFVVTFLIVAFAVYLLIEAIHRAKERMTEKEEQAAAEPSSQEKLLMEIRDLLKARSGPL